VAVAVDVAVGGGIVNVSVGGACVAAVAPVSATSVLLGAADWSSPFTAELQPDRATKIKPVEINALIQRTLFIMLPLFVIRHKISEWMWAVYIKISIFDTSKLLGGRPDLRLYPSIVTIIPRGPVFSR
jgi:predicted membrane-bound dolichyl-phosphate-mannose-protein mannosyltransferase